MNRYPALEVRRHRRRAGRRPPLHAAELLPRSAGGAGVVVEGDGARSTPRCSRPSRTRSRRANIPYRGAALDPTGVKVRFADPDTQLKAKDVLQAKLGDNYIVALNLLSSSPHWLASIGALPMYLGLDLRGGVHFLLQVDMKARARQGRRPLHDRHPLADAREEDRSTSGVGARRSQRRAALQATRPSAPRRASRSRRRSPTSLVREQDAAAASCGSSRASSPRRRSASRTAPSSRTSDPAQPRERARRRRADHPAAGRRPRRRAASRRAGHRARQGHPRPHRDARDPHGQRRARRARSGARPASVPLGSDLFTERNGEPLLVRRQVVLTGDRINDAQPGFDQRTNEPAVHVNLDGTGARIFKEVTRENVGKRMAIVLVEKGKAEVITAPVIREEIGGGRVQISGRMIDARGERHRAADARRRAGGADGDRRGAHRRPVARQGEHREGLQLGAVRLHRAGGLHLRRTTC